MDSRGARHLVTRLAIGAAAGERVEVVAVDDGDARISAGDTGTLVAIGDAVAHVLFDSGTELAVDPLAVQLRPLARPA